MSDDPRPPGSRSPILNVQELLATGLSSDAASAPPVPPTPVPDMPAPMRNRLTPPPALPPVPGVATEGRRRTARASNEEAAAGRSSAGSSPADGDDGRPYRSIEDPVRFSRSHLWALQRAYFERTGVDAWRKNVVPHYVTSNPFIAQAYAQQIIGFLRDLQARGLAGDNPVYILELGGGSGRFTFQVLYALYDRMMRSSLRHVKLRYVFTDFAEKNLAFIANHPQLRPFFESGLLDVAAFDTVRDSRIHLRLNDEILGPSSLRNPLIVLANYVFDSLPHDIFRIRNRAIHEVLIGLDAPADVDEGDPALLPHVRLRNEDVPFEGAYYHDEALDGVLEDYRQGLDDVFITLPIGGFDCISRLADLHEHRQLMLICADKGIHQPADFDIELPPVGRHGSISMQVNLDALGRVIARRGGQALLPTQAAVHLPIATYLVGFGREALLPETRLAFDDALSRFSPDDFFLLKERLEQQAEHLSFNELIAQIRLSAYDPEVFYRCAPHLLEQVGEGLPSRMEEVLHQTLERVWMRYFHLGEPHNVPFQIGRLLDAIGYTAEALRYYERAKARYRPHPMIELSIGVCHLQLRQYDDARASLRACLELDPKVMQARDMLRRCDAAEARAGRGSEAR